MRVHVRPHGNQVQKLHELINSDYVEIDWPYDLRLPVPGDHLNIGSPADLVSGPVEYVRFELDHRWPSKGHPPFVTIKLGSYLP